MILQTKKEQDIYHNKALRKLISHAGTATHLAKMLGLSTSAVNNWTFYGRVSKKGVRRVTEHPTLSKHFTAQQLRQDF